ncbi:MAG: ferritin [Planctomycetota bacterium]|nr:MAG: ferritin [Planctomycetota bacterium]
MLPLRLVMWGKPAYLVLDPGHCPGDAASALSTRLQRSPKMLLDNTIAKALNDHVSVELAGSVSYLSMAAWADIEGLSGFASHFRKEAAGEYDHMNQFVAYLSDRDYQATFNAIPAPRSQWASVEEAMVHAYEMELDLTKRINDLVAQARAASDYFTEAFLAGFIPQQITDTAESEELLKRVRMAKDGQGILIIDQQIATQAAG